MTRKILFLMLFALPAFVSAQEANLEKYWIFLTDKGASLSQSPSAFLSERALERRKAQKIPVDFRDFPVSFDYLQRIAATGADTRRASKWLNAVSAWMSPEELTAVQALPFVKEVRPIFPVQLDLEPLHPPVATKTNYDAGYTTVQTEMIGLEKLHRLGLTGQGIMIAVMDIGFHNANLNPGLDHLFTENRVRYTWDFVENESNVYDSGDHGSNCLSILAGFYPYQFIGSAPGADYLLFCTENGNGERHQEEDNWVRAMEVADSIGADVFSTSLGYSNGMQDTLFINGDTIVNYLYEHLDGNTAIITIAADIAASRGIVVVNSAGNEGLNKITAPADGDSVIAIGAVDIDSSIASFSGRGPTYDGRIKPDLCAQGVSTTFIDIDGNLRSGPGTSYSCPLVAGLAACLLQSSPGYPNMDLYQALIQSAHMYSIPDTNYGYGIPSAELAYYYMHGSNLPEYNEYHFEDFTIAPNPSDGEITVWTGELDYEFDAEIQIFDSRGRLLWSTTKHLFPFYISDSFNIDARPAGLSHGMYLLRIRDLDSKINLYTGRMIIHNN